MDGSTDRACETTRRRRRATGLVAGGLVGGLALAAGLAVPAAAESAPAAAESAPAAAEGAPRTASVPATATPAVGQPALRARSARRWRRTWRTPTPRWRP